MNASELQNELSQCSGSEGYTRHALVKNCIASSGAMTFFENAGNGAFWLWDLLATEVAPLAKRHETVFCMLSVKGSAAVLKVTDGGRGDVENGEKETVLFRREIHFTDCPEGEWRLWMGWDGQYVTVFLPSEY